MVVPVTQQMAEAANLAELHLVCQTAAPHQTGPAAKALVALQRAVSAHLWVLSEALTPAAHRTVVPEQR
jgi:hypothetical protein